MVLVKDRRQANPAMEKLEKWGAVSRPHVNLVIGGMHWPSCGRRDRPKSTFRKSRDVVCEDISIRHETVSSEWVRRLLLERATTDRHGDLPECKSLIDLDGYFRLWGAWRRGFHVGREMWRKYVAELLAWWEILLPLLLPRETNLNKVIVDFTHARLGAGTTISPRLLHK